MTAVTSTIKIEDVGCITGKRTFATKAEATAAATAINRNLSGKRTVYRCDWCAGLHIGNKRRTNSTKSRRR